MFRRGTIFATFFLSLLGGGLVCAALVTQHWVEARPWRTPNPQESAGRIHFGLLQGKKELNVAYGWRTYHVSGMPGLPFRLSPLARSVSRVAAFIAFRAYSRERKTRSRAGYRNLERYAGRAAVRDRKIDRSQDNITVSQCERHSDCDCRDIRDTFRCRVEIPVCTSPISARFPRYVRPPPRRARKSRTGILSPSLLRRRLRDDQRPLGARCATCEKDTSPSQQCIIIAASDFYAGYYADASGEEQQNRRHAL